MIGDVPWRDWLPNFKVPSACGIEGCEEAVTRAVCATANVTEGSVEALRYQQWVFACADHADQLTTLWKAAAK